MERIAEEKERNAERVIEEKERIIELKERIIEEKERITEEKERIIEEMQRHIEAKDDLIVEIKESSNIAQALMEIVQKPKPVQKCCERLLVFRF